MNKVFGGKEREALIEQFGVEKGATYAEFCTRLREEHLFHTKELYTIYQNILHSSPLNMSVVERLRRRAKPDELVSPKVLKGRDILRSYLIDYGYKRTLDESGVTVILGGSLEFNDPKHYDVDWTTIGLRRALVPALTADEINDLINDLEKVWEENQMPVPANDSAEVHQFDSIYITDWRDTNTALIPEKYHSYQTVYYKIYQLGFALTGMPLYNEERTQFEVIQSEAQKVISADPLVRAFVNDSLASVIKDRYGKM